MGTGFVFHERCMWHDAGNAASFVPSGGSVQPDQHAEEPETKRRIRNLMEVSGLLPRLVHIAAEPVDKDLILRVHGRAYVEEIEVNSRGLGGTAGTNTFFSTDGYDIARLSAGGCLSLMSAVVAGDVSNGYSLTRPPGHHARPNEGMGFCLFANAAIGIREVQARFGLSRIAVVDWDAHHGNGTEEIFYTDPSVLTISIHQDNLFPIGTGAMKDRGEGRGEGYNINIPLPPGSGSGAYFAAFDQVVLPALYQYRPELIVVTSGFDASGLDPLARLMLYSDAYRSLTHRLMTAAADLCGGRIAMTHEGGYSRAYAPFCGLAVMETLSGFRTDAVDPFNDYIASFAGQSLQPHQEAVVQHARGLLDRL